MATRISISMGRAPPRTRGLLHAWISLQQRRWAASRVSLSEAVVLLGTTVDADAQQLKERFYTLAKRAHPDANPRDPTAAERFRRLTEAYEVLLGEAEARAAQALGHHGSRPGGRRPPLRRPPSGPRPGRQRRPPTLAQVICRRLDAEPQATDAVWAELRTAGAPIDGETMSALFRACGPGAEMMP